MKSMLLMVVFVAVAGAAAVVFVVAVVAMPALHHTCIATQRHMLLQFGFDYFGFHNNGK